MKYLEMISNHSSRISDLVVKLKTKLSFILTLSVLMIAISACDGQFKSIQILDDTNSSASEQDNSSRQNDSNSNSTPTLSPTQIPEPSSTPITSPSPTSTPSQTPIPTPQTGSNNIETFIPTGFDPGMKKRLAASLFPNLDKYYENCSDSPSGRCFGTLRPAGGFYTLPGNQADSLGDPRRGTCKINSSELYTPALESWRDPNDPNVWNDPSLYNFHVPCPFYFDWKEDSGSPVAWLMVNSIPYKQEGTLNNYHGLQTNVPIKSSYAGIDYFDLAMTPLASDLEFIEFEFKGKICYGDKKSDLSQFGVYHYYSSFWNPVMQKAFTIAFDYGFFQINEKIEGVAPSYIQRETDIPGAPQTEDLKYTFHINNYQYGILPDSSRPLVDNSNDCTLSLNSATWHKVKIPLKTTIQNMIDMGYLSQDLVKSAKYVGGIIAGIETWGRSQTIVMVKNHSLYKKGFAQNLALPSGGIIPAGHFRLAADGNTNVYYSNGNGGYCRYASYDHAGISNLKEVSRVYSQSPVGLNPANLCPGGEFYDNLAKIQASGIYPQGQFRVREEGGTILYYSNGSNSYCKYVNPKHANISQASDIKTIYDRRRQSMFIDSNQVYCSGYFPYLPK